MYSKASITVTYTGSNRRADQRRRMAGATTGDEEEGPVGEASERGFRGEGM
jgi:hypothetical protein